MAKTKQKIDIRQTNLFDLIREVEAKRDPVRDDEETAGSLNIDATLREMVTASLKTSRSADMKWRQKCLF